MYKPKHLKHERTGRWNKSATLLVSLLLLLGVTVGGTLAYLITSDGPVTNTFTSSKVTTEVKETLEGTTKKSVYIQNTGDTDVWIRAAVIVTWQDADGNVYGQKPVAGTNYTNWTSGTDWEQGDDGFYYYKQPVAANGGMTGVLISEISPIGQPPADGYFLTVEILGSGIQSVPTNVVTDNWSSGVSGVGANGTLTIK